MFKRILVPVDGSKGAEAALDMALQLQSATGGKAELLILTVFRHHGQLEASFSMVRASEPNNIDDALRDHAKEIAESGKAHAKKSGAKKVRAFVKNGPPARSIVAFAREHEVDLIVLGSRGLGSIEGYLLGSVSHKVTGLAECPVLVV
ncbi:universal stress protein UspA [Maritimibacter sp. 55A14]|uniref:universal stress protein n=1 Tax=Maritimibacter sp. 55A14 TaxID=2174844 RepID=UPI000D60DAB5|nr:universal stress protein [Maritimibacter sp. 55A14]PWE33767.1 universal stress protein UspA [Maritimibacter sp. 55A14]